MKRMVSAEGPNTPRPATAAIVAALLIALPFVAAACGGGRGGAPAYRDARLTVDERVADLLGRMTIEEKLGQLRCGDDMGKLDEYADGGFGALACVLRGYGPKEAAERAATIKKLFIERSRLGIPVLIHDEGLHGLVGRGATSFPQAIGLAAAWDVDLETRVARAIAREARTRGIRQLLSPVVNIARDARWGRVEETFGEDTFLTSRLGAAFCRALQDEGVIATPKHLIANVGDGGRDSNSVDLNKRILNEVYFPPFEACIKEGGALSVMSAYNSIDGRPCSSNRDLLTGTLRGDWGFKGFVVSDYGSVGGIRDLHKAAGTWGEAGKQAIEAGLDMELPTGYVFGAPLLEMVKGGKVPMSVVDEAVKRVLYAKFSMGLFEEAATDPEEAERVNDSAEHRALALEAARKAIVLLKNDGGCLPLRKDLGTIAVLGPVSDEARLGGYSGSGMRTVSILEGIKRIVSPSTRVLWAKGCDIDISSFPAVPAALLIPSGGKPGQHGLKGEYFDNRDLSGRPVIERVDDRIGFDWGSGSPDPRLDPDRFSVRWTGKLVPGKSGPGRFSVTSDDGARLWIDGKLLIDRWIDRGPVTDVVSLDLEAGRAYDIRLEYYEAGGGALVSLGWDGGRGVESGITAAARLASKADVAVIVCGVVEGEGRDRAVLDLPGGQEELIKRTAATGVPVVVVLVNGGAVTMGGWIEKAAGVVEAWYPGEEGGNAVADVLFGDFNPSGRLPVTFPLSVGQVPLYYNYKPTGRGYDYVETSGKPLFPFGHGLSYTTFAYSGLTVSQSAPPSGEMSSTVSFKLRNTGQVAGDEVVEFYIHRYLPGFVTPVRELAGFKHVALAPGEEKTVTFELRTGDLYVFGPDTRCIISPAGVEIEIGGSSGDIRLRGYLPH